MPPNVAQFQIKLNGSLVPAEMMDDLHAVEVDSSLYMPAAATIELYDQKLKWVDDGQFAIGADIEVLALSNPTAGQPTTESIFKGVIAAIEPYFSNEETYAMFCVRAYDRLYLLHRGNVTKTYRQVTDSDLASQVIGGAGLQAEVESTSIVHEHVYRDDTSDYDFLKMLAARNGFVLVCAGTTAKFKAPLGLGIAELELEYGSDLIEFRPALSLSGQVNEVEVGGWDRKKKEAVLGRSTSATFTPNATGFPSRGYAMAQSAHSAKKLHLVEPAQTQSEMEATAKSVLNRMAANDLTGEGLAVGNPKIKPGGQLKVTKIGSRFSGKYFVTRVRHRLDQQAAYTTEFWMGGMNSGTVASLVSPGLPSTAAPPHRMNGLVTAIVTNNADPENQGRVKLKFPQISATDESNWAPVVSAGAGKQYGLQVLPEVNDEVIVGFLNGDINFPYVLGGLWNGKDAPPEPAAVENGKVETRIFKSRVGHILRFTDKSGSEKIELIDKTGKNLMTIDSAQNSITISASKDITIEAKANLTLKGMNVKIEGQTKIDASAPVVQAEGKTQIALKGAIAELTGQAQAKVSAALVMIN